MQRLVVCTLLLLSIVAGPAARAAEPAPVAAGADYRVTDPLIASFVRQHGDTRGLGAPISNVFRLLGQRVQLFQRGAVAIRSDGSAGTLDLVSGSFLPVAALLNSGQVEATPRAPVLMANNGDSLLAAGGILDQTAPNQWQGLPVHFGAAFRASLACPPNACDARSQLRGALDLWGLPIGQPVLDVGNRDFVYLPFERGVMVYSRAAADTQWLLLGELFKQVLVGKNLPPEMVTHINAAPQTARFLAQYDPLARDGVARPAVLVDTSLDGAFSESRIAATANGPLAAPAAPTPKPKPAPAVALDARFGVAEGLTNAAVLQDLRAGWERVVIPWDQVQPDGPADLGHLGFTLPADKLRADVVRGVRVAAVLQFTPGWAQANPAAGQRSVPRNLDRPFDDPSNYWGRFVYQTVKLYAGRIDEFVIWNEPEFRPGDVGNGDSYNWAGTDEDFAQLLKVAYLAAKKANPSAAVSFPSTSYWVDELSSPRRAPFYERMLNILSRDPRAAERGYYHDAVGLNLYGNADDTYRVHGLFTAIQRKYGLDKPLWLTESNALPTDDTLSGCGDQSAAAGARTTLEQQAAYGMQAFALAAAAGYQRIAFYKMSDSANCQEPTWGLVRTDGSRRPVADALRTAITYFSGFTRARFVPLVRPVETWPAWPTNPTSYTPNWQVYQVALDRPGNQRVTVLWNGDAAALRIRLVRRGSSARVVDRRGVERGLTEDSGSWLVDLPGAGTRRDLDDTRNDPDGYHAIGGEPILLVEEGVPPSEPVTPARLVN